MQSTLRNPFQIVVMMILAMVFALVAGCANGPPTATADDKAGLAMQAVTAARKATTAALVAKKITVAQDQAVQAKLDVAVTVIKAALAANDIATLAAQKTAADSVAANPGASP